MPISQPSRGDELLAFLSTGYSGKGWQRVRGNYRQCVLQLIAQKNQFQMEMYAKVCRDFGGWKVKSAFFFPFFFFFLALYWPTDKHSTLASVNYLPHAEGTPMPFENCFRLIFNLQNDTKSKSLNWQDICRLSDGSVGVLAYDIMLLVTENTLCMTPLISHSTT